jgi:hypothetical protein
MSGILAAFSTLVGEIASQLEDVAAGRDIVAANALFVQLREFAPVLMREVESDHAR